MPDNIQSAMLRQWATQCAAEADNPKISAEQRERLLKMRHALLEMAKTHDWLERQTPTQEQQQINRRGRKRPPAAPPKSSRLKGAYEKSRR
jgi:hypothetical protein